MLNIADRSRQLLEVLWEGVLGVTHTGAHIGDEDLWDMNFAEIHYVYSPGIPLELLEYVDEELYLRDFQMFIKGFFGEDPTVLVDFTDDNELFIMREEVSL